MDVFIDKNSEEKVVSKYDELEQNVWEFFMNKLPKLGFESREGQEDMALDICTSIKEHQHTIIEAGVGIGKSYAYIVPLLYYNMLFEKPVLIATSTIALQEQLINDVKKISKLIKYKPDILLAKGMRHFACKSRADKYFSNINFINISQEEEMLYRYINIGKSDRKNMNYDFKDELWENVNVVATNHNNCEYYNSCAFIELRRKMLECNGVIICNQDLLTVHLEKVANGQKGILNEEIDLIVIDEAHNLEEKVRSSLVRSYNKEKIKFIARQSIYNIEKKSNKELAIEVFRSLNNTVNLLFNNLIKQVKNQIKSSEEVERFFVDFRELKEDINCIIEGLNKIYNIIKLNSSEINWDESVEELKSLIAFWNRIINNENEICWLEIKKGVEIYICPKNIEKQIKRLYFNKDKTTILTSATLTNKKIGDEVEQYEYLIKNIGFPIDIGFLSAPKESPFPYNKNTILYYKDKMPHPTYERDKYIIKASEEILKLLEVTKGKALILFTSKRDLNEVYNILDKKRLKYNLIKQRSMSSQDEIIDKFKNDQDSVLLATGSFWEGVDIPGIALSNVIIFRLPFPVPDPIIEEKRKVSNNFLMDVAVPLMIVKLRQGIGRLIRRDSDRGIVAILDSRVENEEYKKIIFDSIPVKNKTKNIKDLKDFWERK